MPTIYLTPEQWEHMKREANEVQMLTDAELDRIAARLGKSKNIPFVKPEKEEALFRKAIQLLDSVLYNSLPPEVYENINNAQDGFDKKEKRKLINQLTRTINRKVDIPYLPETLEKYIIKGFLHIVVGAFVNGMNLNQSLQEAVPAEPEE